MAIGLGSYAFFWQWHQSAERPLGLTELVDRTADLGVTVFQICDDPRIETLDADALAALRRHAAGRGVALELGTRGLRPDHLLRHLQIARALGTTLVRSMVTDGEDRPDLAEAVRRLRQTLPAYAEAGVTLALETYEQVPVADLVRIVQTVDSPALGICLDPGNGVAALELPRTTVELSAPHVRNLHIKDFAFRRRDGWVGFSYTGARLGEGLLDYQHLVETVRPDERGINQIIEHWLPWQGDSASTIELEQEWTSHALAYLRSRSS